MKKKFFFVLLISTVLLGQKRVITLEECLVLGLQNSKEIEISEAKLKISDSQVSEITAQMLPVLSLEAGYTKLSDVPPFRVTVPFSPIPIQIQETILNAYNLKLSVKQPLFTGFRLSSLRSASKANFEANKLEFDQSRNDKAFAIYKTFWNYYKAQQGEGNLRETLNSLKNHLRDTENFVKSGLATQSDLLKLKVRIANLQLSLIDADNALLLAQNILNKELGLPLNSETEINATEPSVMESLPVYKELLFQALSKRNELKAINLRIDAGKENVTASNAGWYPQIFAYGDFYYSRPNQRIMPAEDIFNDTWDVGVGLQWNLWDWGSTSAKVTQAEQILIQTEKNAELIKEAIQLEVHSNYLKMKSSLEKVTVGKLGVESAEENYRITKVKYNQQLATSTELIDAEVELYNAKTNLSTSLVDYELARIALEKSAAVKIY